MLAPFGPKVIAGRLAVQLPNCRLLVLRGGLPLLLQDGVHLGRLLCPAAPELEAHVLDMLVDDDPRHVLGHEICNARLSGDLDQRHKMLGALLLQP